MPDKSAATRAYAAHRMSRSGRVSPVDFFAGYRVATTAASRRIAALEAAGASALNRHRAEHGHIKGCGCMEIAPLAAALAEQEVT